MSEIDYERMYLHLFNKITDALKALHTALETGEADALEHAILRIYVDLTRAQSEAENMYLSQ